MRLIAVFIAAVVMSAGRTASVDASTSSESQPDRQGVAPGSAPQVMLGEQLELARLVDIAAQRLKVNIEYDAAQLKGTVTLRLGAGVSDQDLWELANRLLASRGFVTVRAPGRDGVLSVVKLEAAAGVTQIDGISSVAGSSGPVPGFGATVYRLRHRAAKDVTELIKHGLSKPGGAVTAIRDDLLLITDLTSRAPQTLAFLEMVDVPGSAVEVVEVPSVHLSGVQLTTLAAQVVAKRDLVAGTKIMGEVLPGPDGQSVLVIAPREVHEFWRGLLTALDKREPLETRSYIPRYFELSEVQRLIQETVGGAETATGGGSARSAAAGARGSNPETRAGSDDRLRIVVDGLTGTLIVTATAAQHQHIADLIDRLNAVPPEGRRPMRIFKVRNRGVHEVLSVLQTLVSSGDLAGDLVNGVEGGDSPAPSASDAVATPSRPAAPPGIRLADGDAATPNVANPARQDASATVHKNETRRIFSKAPGSKDVAREVVLTADEGTSSIIAVGEPRLLSQIERLIQQLDIRQPQVMVQALVVTLNESQTRDLGLELEGQINLSGDSILRLSSLFGLSSAGAEVGRRTAGGAGGTGLLLSPGEFAVVIRALETINHGRSVSLPQVLVNNNQQASFNSTVEQPFATVTNAGDINSSTGFGGSSSAGTVVTAKPQIGQGDHLILDYTVELSAFVGQASDPTLPPPKQTNNVASSVTLPDGFTIAVGGLELTTEGESEDRIPLLSQIPLAGELFKNRSKSTSRNRFFIFLRAEVMRHERFDDLKYHSDLKAAQADVPTGWPTMEPRVIR